jgi:cystathionine beta-lyase
MLAFELDDSVITAEQFQKRLRMITPAVSLGGVETIICSPKLTSHAKISAEERAELGIADSLLRLSVGIEDVDDIIADIENALSV